MRFENPQLPEDVNVGKSRPLADFAAITLGILAVAALCAAVLYLGAGRIAKRVPFETEARLAARFIEPKRERPPIELALQRLADRLLARMDAPAGTQVHVHYNDASTVNAFATIGGNITIYRGLLERLPHENALAMVLAHEIAHVVHRDPAVGAGRGLALALVLSALSAGQLDAMSGSMISGAATLTGLTFSCELEAAADVRALEALAAEYGHVGGAVDLFELFKRLRAAGQGNGEPPRILASHPLTDERIRSITTLAGERGWSSAGRITPLDAVLTPPARSRP